MIDVQLSPGRYALKVNLTLDPSPTGTGASYALAFIGRKVLATPGYLVGQIGSDGRYSVRFAARALQYRGEFRHQVEVSSSDRFDTIEASAFADGDSEAWVLPAEIRGRYIRYRLIPKEAQLKNYAPSAWVTITR